jgi:hypothetical protein
MRTRIKALGMGTGLSGVETRALEPVRDDLPQDSLNTEILTDQIDPWKSDPPPPSPQIAIHKSLPQNKTGPASRAGPGL